MNTSPLVEIELEDITRATVPAGQITYVHTDYAGNADIVVLNDATGDCYTYGMLKVETTRKPIYGDLENPDTVTGWSTTTHVGIENAENPSPAADLLTYTNYRKGLWGRGRAQAEGWDPDAGDRRGAEIRGQRPQ